MDNPSPPKNFLSDDEIKQIRQTNPLHVSVVRVKSSNHINDPCKECHVCVPPTRPFPPIEEFIPLVSPPTSNRYEDYSDAIYYRLPNGQQQITLADYRLLCSGFDRCLLNYFFLQQECSSKNKKNIPPSLMPQISYQLKSSQQQRKVFYYSLPEGSLRNRYYLDFAYSAKLDLLCRQLFLSKNATKKASTPQYACTFFSMDFFKLESENYYDLKIPDFKLEDYILFERNTAISFLVEACAVLTSIRNPQIQLACTNVLKKNLNFFLESPFLLSRISLMRQFVIEAAFTIDWKKKHGFYDYMRDLPSSEDITAHMEAHAQNVLDNLPKVCATILDPSSLCDADFKSKKNCRNNLFCMLKNVSAPIDLVSYVESPIYGPVAFCNPRHEGVKTLLDDIAIYNSIAFKKFPKKIPKRWSAFVDLFQSVQFYIHNQAQENYAMKKVRIELNKSRQNMNP